MSELPSETCCQIAEKYLPMMKEASPDLMLFILTNWPQLLAGGLAAYYVSTRARHYIQRRGNDSKIKSNKIKFAEKKRKMEEKLRQNSSSQLITPERANILGLEINELVEKLKSGALDPLAVMEAYQAKALEATADTNCIVEFLDESLDLAKALRSIPEDERGPLFGVPISVKECFFVKGYDSTAGLARHINKPVTMDSTFIKRLRELGAIPFCLTNVPQTMKTYACSNPVYGCTSHPLDKTRTPGGSSGGEACLLAQGGSILGIGSDIGGSLRTPSHFCGTAALKPTSGRLMEKGRRPGGSGKVIGIHSNTGFMSRSVDGVILGMRSILQDPIRMAQLDYMAVPLPWREELFLPNRKLKIGWYDDDGYFPATPCCKRAVHEAAAILQKLGHEVVHFQPPHLVEIVNMYFDHMLADDGITSLEVWEGEILDQAVETNKFVFKTPNLIKRFVLKPIFHFVSKILADLTTRGYLKTVDMWKSMMRLDDVIEDFVNAWAAENLDVVLCPGFTYPAPPTENPGRLIPAISYPCVFNVIDFPVGTVPITRVNDQDQVELKSSYPKNEDLLYKLVYNGALGTQGLPLNVQVIGRPWNEELVLHVMKLLESNRSISFP